MGSSCCKDGDKYDQKYETKSVAKSEQMLDQSYNGVEIIVKKAEILREKAEAIVLGTDLYLLNQNSFSQTDEEREAIKKVYEQYKGMNDNEQQQLGNATEKVVNYGEAVETNIQLKNNQNIKCIISVSLPLWRGGNKQELKYLQEGIKNALLNGGKFESLAFTDIASGIFGFPKQEVAEILTNQIKLYLDQQGGQSQLKKIYVVLRDDSTILQFEREIKKMIGIYQKDQDNESWTNSQIRTYQQDLIKPIGKKQNSMDNVDQALKEQNEVKAQLIEGQV
ncbi:hypothetical protein PPERSA_08840 [Pseudocohnilembus persalinus]|uniref:Macro domain-containing protein n=1 Tax=Pseudocohnilembus persalinus TaxID=266149 RepID=A0A0V0R3Q7_PSEPJ|nr:hypothetical protein PPERSA_08840 [Pseudocohnilembus persalinus]|eukprot:KRX09124.1 hypothetical protein PPERSA_08840 [Pseudocohnilembus persalinus]